MSKIIVPKEQITQDPRIALIKAFRIANKRAGEAARDGDNISYARRMLHMGALVNQADQEFGFHIWVNANGNTGHTHTHDYKESRDSDNDYGAHLLVINRVDGEFANDDTSMFPHEESPRQPSKFTGFDEESDEGGESDEGRISDSDDDQD